MKIIAVDFENDDRVIGLFSSFGMATSMITEAVAKSNPNIPYEVEIVQRTTSAGLKAANLIFKMGILEDGATYDFTYSFGLEDVEENKLLFDIF